MFWDKPAPTVVVSTISGQLLRGALVKRQADSIVLRSASVASVERNQQSRFVALDGDVVVPWVNIDFYQTGLDASLLERETLK